MFQYQPKMYGPFKDQFLHLSDDIKLRTIEAIDSRLKTDPTRENNPVRSEMLKASLECFRRIHITDDIVLVYTVCQECKGYLTKENITCQEKIGCFNCVIEPWYRIKMIYVGDWTPDYEDVVSRWRAWINTANEALMS